MKKIFLGLGFVLPGLLMLLSHCKKDENPVQGMTLVSLTSDQIVFSTSDTAATPGIDPTFNFIAKFSNTVDYSTVGDSSIILRRDTARLKVNFIVAGNTITIDPAIDLLTGAHLTLEIKNTIKSINGFSYEGGSFEIITAGVGVDTPPHAGNQIVYVQFNSAISDVTGHATLLSSKLTYTTDRYGVAGRAGHFSQATSAGEGDIVELMGTNFIPPSMTISVWFNMANLAYTTEGVRGLLGLAGDKGYYIEVGSDSINGPDALTFATDHSVKSSSDGKPFHLARNRYTGRETTNDSTIYSAKDSVNILVTDGWHQLVMTFDSITSLKTVYIDARKFAQWNVSPPSLGRTLGGLKLDTSDTLNLRPVLAVGYYGSKLNTVSPAFQYATSSNTYLGDLDDLRIFNIAYTAEEVKALYVQESTQ